MHPSLSFLAVVACGLGLILVPALIAAATLLLRRSSDER
jgi:hypothetical protein